MSLAQAKDRILMAVAYIKSLSAVKKADSGALFKIVWQQPGKSDAFHLQQMSYS